MLNAKQSDSGRLPLKDPKGMAMVIRQRMEERYLLDPLDPLLTSSEESRRYFWGAKTSILRATVEDSGISRPTLHRLVHGTLPVCSWRTLTRLLRWVGEDSEEQLYSCAVGPEMAEMRAGYEEFLARELGRMKKGRSEKDLYAFVPKSEVANSVAYFRQYVKDLGLPAPRETLALFRVFEPFIAWRPLRDRLSEKQVAKLVRLGLKRERALLKEEAKLLGYHSWPAGA